jgi:hypothetical protein
MILFVQVRSLKLIGANGRYFVAGFFNTFVFSFVVDRCYEAWWHKVLQKNLGCQVATLSKPENPQVVVEMPPAADVVA